MPASSMGVGLAALPTLRAPNPAPQTVDIVFPERAQADRRENALLRRAVAAIVVLVTVVDVGYLVSRL